MSQPAHRQAETILYVQNKDHEPLRDTVIHAELYRHEFLFGCGAFETVPYTNGVQPGQHFGSISDEEEQNRKEILEDRVQKWLGLFNYGTLPFYWGGFEPKEGEPHTKQLMNAARFLQDHDVVIKGHPLCWHTVCAPWLLKYDTDTILEKQLARIRRDAGDFRGLVDMWDVINEVVIMPVYDKYDNAATRMCKKLGRVGLIKKVFEETRKANPDATLLLNDFNLSQAYEILIDGCLNAGVSLDVIGLQSHQHHGVWGREKREEILSRFEYFGLPIHFTENTIVAGPKVDEKIVDLQDAHYNDEDTSPEYEEMQADALEEMYRGLFEEHPLVTAITNWDFGDGAWLNAPSGFIRKDGSLKPSYLRLQKLIKEEWHTSVNLKTDAEGRAVLKGYRGTYRITGSQGETKCMLAAGQKETRIIL